MSAFHANVWISFVLGTLCGTAGCWFSFEIANENQLIIRYRWKVQNKMWAFQIAASDSIHNRRNCNSTKLMPNLSLKWKLQQFLIVSYNNWTRNYLIVLKHLKMAILILKFICLNLQVKITQEWGKKVNGFKWQKKKNKWDLRIIMGHKHII